MSAPVVINPDSPRLGVPPDAAGNYLEQTVRLQDGTRIIVRGAGFAPATARVQQQPSKQQPGKRQRRTQAP